MDWDSLFSLGLGQVNHAFVTEERHPNCEIIERKTIENGLERRDVTIRTAGGELHEYYLGDSNKGVLPWRMEHFIKTPSDYRLMARALEGSTYSPTDRAFDESEAAIGDRGITIAHVDRTPVPEGPDRLRGHRGVLLPPRRRGARAPRSCSS